MIFVGEVWYSYSGADEGARHLDMKLCILVCRYEEEPLVE